MEALPGDAVSPPVIPFYNFATWHVAGVTLYSFGLLVAAGALVGHAMAMRRARALGLQPIKQVDVFAIWVLGCGFVAGHVLDEVLYHPDILRAHPIELVMLHHGLSSMGGIAGAVAGGVGFILVRKLPAWVYADLCAYAFPFGWLLGRAGCSIAHDHPGRRTTSLLAVNFPANYPPPPEQPFGGPRFDLGLLEFALTPLLIALVVLVARRTRRPGMIAGALAVAYPLVRFPLDFLRATDLGMDSDPRYAGLTPAQWACLGLLLAGLAILWTSRKRPPWGIKPVGTT